MLIPLSSYSCRRIPYYHPRSHEASSIHGPGIFACDQDCCRVCKGPGMSACCMFATLATHSIRSLYWRTEMCGPLKMSVVYATRPVYTPSWLPADCWQIQYALPASGDLSNQLIHTQALFSGYDHTPDAAIQVHGAILRRRKRFLTVSSQQFMRLAIGYGLQFGLVHRHLFVQPHQSSYDLLTRSINPEHSCSSRDCHVQA